MHVIGRLALATLGLGCSEPALPDLPELVRATDTNPDPAIVEVTLVATAFAGNQLAYRDGSGAATIPGPLIEANRGDRLIVHFRNELPDRSTTVHWHGLRLPIEMDGDPMVVDPVPPGGTYDYAFTLADAGLYWYHPHVATDEQVELGLQGPLLVHDAGEPAVDADRTFVLDDVDLLADGTVRIAPTRDDLMLGRRGATLLVNGAAAPVRVVSARNAIERWRIVNTSNGRFFDLALAGRVIGWDGGLVAAPYDVDHLVVAPGERYDVLVALAEPVTLATREVARGDGLVDAAAELVRVELAGEPLAARALPAVAGDVAPLAVDAATPVRTLRLREDLDGAAGAVFYINDQRWPFNIPMPVQLGALELWDVVNDNDHAHPFHVHGHFVQVQGAAQLGWKDTVVVPARATVRFAVRYEALGKWMAHCQIPEHAERGMTADIQVQEEKP
jgi:FtsP/CotA-like multicopper oxidase with cupredoxin domain